MKILARMLLAILLPAGMAVASAQGAEAIKAGQWEFSTQLRMPGAAAPPPGIQPGQADGMAVTHKQCIDPDRAVPSDPRPECKIIRMQRRGSAIAWSSSCRTAQGTVDSAGTARYAGDTMEATLDTRAPDGHGGFINTSQHITGHYLGPCAGQ